MPAICLFTFASQELLLLFPHRLAMCSGTLLPALSNIADRSVWSSSSISRHSASNFSLQYFSLFSAFSRGCLSVWSCFSTSSLERKRLLVKGLATPLLSSFLFLHFWTKWCSFFAIGRTLPYTGDYGAICRKCPPFRIFGWTCQIRVIASFMGKCSMECLCNCNATT